MKYLDYERFRNYVSSYIWNPLDAEDVFYNAVCKVLQSCRSVDTITISYMWVSLHWAINDYIRDYYRDQIFVAENNQGVDFQPDYGTLQLYDLVMAEMPDSVKLYFEGYSQMEIARQYGVTENAIKARKFKFVRKMRHKYNYYGTN